MGGLTVSMSHAALKTQALEQLFHGSRVRVEASQLEETFDFVSRVSLRWEQSGTVLKAFDLPRGMFAPGDFAQSMRFRKQVADEGARERIRRLFSKV